MNATDRIDYTRPFAENVKGYLYARFRLDPDGLPLFEVVEDRLHLYTIDIFLHSPLAETIKNVEYTFGDPAYTEPIGQSTDRDNDFRETIESYGEVPVVVRVRVGFHLYEQRAWLSQMLENGHAKDMTPSIQSAILRIKVN